MAAPTVRAAGRLLVAVVVLSALAVAGWVLLRQTRLAEPLPGQQRCVATAGGNSAVLDLDQAHYAAIIVGLSVKRGLPPRAASIAMATAYQETGIRNLDYGDRDSVGLFQQRPSAGWGTVEEIMDPYYATGAFYDALVKVPGWRTGDINDVAQKVQVSGYPEAYRDHEQDARVVASALTGQSAAAFTCLDRTGARGNAKALAASLRRTFGRIGPRQDGRTVTVDADSAALAWAYGAHAVANASRYGVVEVVVGKRVWRTDDFDLPAWEAAPEALGSREVRITVG